MGGALHLGAGEIQGGTLRISGSFEAILVAIGRGMNFNARTQRKMTEPYTTPQTSPQPETDEAELRRRRKFWLRIIWLSIAGIILPPLSGVPFAAFGILRAYSELSQGDEANPGIGRAISASLSLTAFGLVVSAIAFMVLMGALVRFFSLPRVFEKR